MIIISLLHDKSYAAPIYLIGNTVKNKLEKHLQLTSKHEFTQA